MPRASGDGQGMKVPPKGQGLQGGLGALPRITRHREESGAGEGDGL